MNFHFIIHRREVGPHLIEIFQPDQKDEAIESYDRARKPPGPGACMVSSESLASLVKSQAHSRLMANLTRVAGEIPSS